LFVPVLDGRVVCGVVYFFFEVGSGFSCISAESDSI